MFPDAFKCCFLSLLLIITVILPAYGWQHEIAIGYGNGKEIEQDYFNEGIAVSGKVYRFRKIDDTLIASIDCTLAHIHSDTPEYNSIGTAAIALAMRAYFSNPECHCINPYLQMSFGPAYLSEKQLGNCLQGEHYAFQTTMETGIEIGNSCRSVDINLRIIHFCNAGIFNPNNGIDLVPVLSIGYLF